MPDNLPKEFNQKQSLNHPCPVCGVKDGAVLGCLKYALFDGSPIADTYNVVGCAGCGFVFCDVPSSQQNYDKFYEEYFYSSAYLSRVVDPGEQQYLEQTVRIIGPYLKAKDARIFDIGCGTGSLLKRLQAAGYTNLYGVDPSASCVEMVNQQDGLRAEIGSLENIPFAKTKADVIILCHILEHVLGLSGAFKGISEKLSKNGIVYIEVPDAKSYDSFKDVSPLRYFYLQHLIHFDKTHLRNLLLSHGFIQLAGDRHTRVEGDLQMPCVWGIFRKASAAPDKIKPDFDLARRVKGWFAKASLDPDGILADLASSQAPVYVWGIGIHVQMMLAMSPLGRCNIKYFVDKDTRVQGKTLQDRKIYPPDVLNNAGAKEVVVIGAPTHSEEMYRYLIEQLGFKGRVAVCGFGDVRLKG